VAALSFVFGHTSNPNKYLVQILILYVVLISIHLILNWYWLRNTQSFKSLIILSLGICILSIFYTAIGVDDCINNLKKETVSKVEVPSKVSNFKGTSNREAHLNTRQFVITKNINTLAPSKL